MGRHADEFERATKALQDRLQARIDRLRDSRMIAPLKPPDARTAHAVAAG
ncbi:hypothetical protein GTA62_20495 [Roseobacter sp. HKCCD9010]|nr:MULTISPECIES: hypothetical protein [unclassified Roseobacter]MBF9052376.1 hypothetical protein [Rhodobacterales bacterium HKCCD4356]NNV14363.1 hypothetical protein [Roseobacter sp. HKCCD7357]NNV18542.1 hypothetical protein [Roseobacter sp. HKCCD8768]NNV27993.1 hypothetical protein [Roseobacter sp. HKCCD8192]NNV32293.1 hypothetical protein [Roseobacter sp. HKCCD9061]